MHITLQTENNLGVPNFTAIYLLFGSCLYHKHFTTDQWRHNQNTWTFILPKFISVRETGIVRVVVHSRLSFDHVQVVNVAVYHMFRMNHSVDVLKYLCSVTDRKLQIRITTTFNKSDLINLPHTHTRMSWAGTGIWYRYRSWRYFMKQGRVTVTEVQLLDYLLLYIWTTYHAKNVPGQHCHELQNKTSYNRFALQLACLLTQLIQSCTAYQITWVDLRWISKYSAVQCQKMCENI